MYNTSRSVTLARIALCIALLAVCAWITIPIGAVPITLQIFACALAICVLPSKESVCVFAGYLVLGAIGVPVFSSMRGGIGVLAGPTGGFIWGYVVGALLALLLSVVIKKETYNSVVFGALKCVLLLCACYICGMVQFCAVMGVDLQAAFLACVAPFVVLDAIKIVLAILCSKALVAALGFNKAHKQSLE